MSRYIGLAFHCDARIIATLRMFLPLIKYASLQSRVLADITKFLYIQKFYSWHLLLSEFKFGVGHSNIDLA